MSTVTFARGGGKAPAKGGGIVSTIADAISGVSGGCGNGTHNGKRGFQPGNKCSGNRNPAVSAAQKAHTAANAVTRKHVKAGTLNTPAGRAAIKAGAKAHRELQAARTAHKEQQKVARAEKRRTTRAAAKATAATPAGKATAILKAAHAEAKPVEAPKPVRPAKDAAPKPDVKAEVAKASSEAGEIKAKAAAGHLRDIHAGVESGRHDAATAAKHIDKLARGHTRDELFAAAKAAGIEHSATTKVALVRHLKDHASAAVPAAGPPAGKLPLKDFASRVVEAARDTPTGGVGKEKTFINHVKAHLEKTDPAFRGMSDAAFKARLLEADHARHLELGRGDLIEAFNPADVKASKTPYMTTEYHFIRHPEAAGKAQSHSEDAIRRHGVTARDKRRKP